MNAARPAERTGAARLAGARLPAAHGFAGWLSLAAAPTFAAIALLSALFESDASALLCGPAAFPLEGMVPMYLLMSLFHLSPWLRLVAWRQRAGWCSECGAFPVNFKLSDPGSDGEIVHHE